MKPEDLPDYHEPWFRDVCSACGVTSGLSIEFVLSRIDTQRQIFCINGHTGTMSKSYVETMKDRVLMPWDQLVKQVCGNCGLTFQMEKGTYEDRKAGAKNFVCPNGCVRAYIKPPPPPKTEADVDYEKMISYHGALGVIAAIEPRSWHCREQLVQAINIARNILELAKLKDET